MNSREEYTEHLVQMNEIEDKGNIFSDAENKARDKQALLIKEIILEHKLLQKGVWVLDWPDENDPPILILQNPSEWILDDESLRSLSDNSQNVNLEIEAAKCYLSHTEVEIFFEDSNEVSPFIHHHKMTVDRTYLRKKELELKKQLRSLKKYKAI